MISRTTCCPKRPTSGSAFSRGRFSDPEDEVFVGFGDGRKTRCAKIPSRYWKVIVARLVTAWSRMVSYSSRISRACSSTS